MKNSLIILSGGMDSVTLLYDQKDYIALAVTFDYGSNHNKREAELAAYHCKRLGIIDAMNQAMAYGTYEHINIFAPYTLYSKTDIAKVGKVLGIDYSKTYSCYKGGEKHCGKCGTCVERKEALRDAGIDDPTEYEE